MYIHEPAVIWPYIIKPSRSYWSNCSCVAQCGTMLVFAIKTRGASVCDLKMPTGLPDWIINVSSSFNSLNERRIASKLSQFRAALPRPPYTIRLSGSNATSGSRLFCIIRYAASISQFLQLNSVPFGAFIVRDIIFFNHNRKPDR